MKRVRLDQLLVDLHLVESRAKARAVILAGRVYIQEERVDKAGTLVRTDASITVRWPKRRFVSRGGEKLEGAMSALSLDVDGFRVVDIGASTGGFTDCLLQRGAKHVYAIDVGYGQLHEKIRSDARVSVFERFNARHLELDMVDSDPVDLVVVDASFIGLSAFLPAFCRILKPGGHLIVLVKPQFEVGPEHVGRNGVVRSDEVRKKAVDEFSRVALKKGFVELGRAESVLKGPKGNQETFMWLGFQPSPHAAPVEFEQDFAIKRSLNHGRDPSELD